MAIDTIWCQTCVEREREREREFPATSVGDPQINFKYSGTSSLLCFVFIISPSNESAGEIHQTRGEISKYCIINTVPILITDHRISDIRRPNCSCHHTNSKGRIKPRYFYFAKVTRHIKYSIIKFRNNSSLTKTVT